MVKNELHSPPTTTGRDAWLAVISIAMATFAGVTTEFLPVGLLTDIAGDFGVSDGTAGWMVTLPGITAALTATVVLLFAGKVNRRHLLIGLTGLIALSNVIAALAPDFTTMLIARILLGVTVGGVWTIATGMSTRLVEERWVPRATAIVLTGISLGAVLGLPAGTLIGDAAGWRAAFWTTAGVAALALALQLRLLPSLPSEVALRPRDLGAVLSRRIVKVSLVLVAAVFVAQFAAYTFVEPFLRDEAQVSSGTISVLLLLYGLAGLISNAVASSYAPGKPGATMAVGVISIILATALFPVVATGAGGAALLLLVWGLGWGIVPLAFTLRMFASTPDSPEAGMGLLVTTIQLSIASGAAIGGLVVDASGTQTVMVLGAALLAAALLWHAATHRTVRADAQDLAAQLDAEAAAGGQAARDGDRGAGRAPIGAPADVLEMV